MCEGVFFKPTPPTPKKVWPILPTPKGILTNSACSYRGFGQSCKQPHKIWPTHPLQEKVWKKEILLFPKLWPIPRGPAEGLTDPPAPVWRIPPTPAECLTNSHKHPTNIFLDQPSLLQQKFNSLPQKVWPIPLIPTEGLTNPKHSCRKFDQFHMLQQNVWVIPLTPKEILINVIDSWRKFDQSHPLLQKGWLIPPASAVIILLKMNEWLQ